MIVVLDASAAVGIVLQREDSRSAENCVENASLVIGPSLYISEVTNVFWKYYRFHDLPQNDCEMGIERCLKIVDDFADDGELWRESFAMSCLTGLTAYDMCYLVLARRYNAMLVTLDQKLQTACRKHSVKALE